jgi:hypothetical protein
VYTPYICVTQHADGLSGVCEQLLYKVLYSSNSEGLEELDSECESPTTSSSNNMLDDADEDSSSSAKYTGKHFTALYRTSTCVCMSKVFIW